MNVYSFGDRRKTGLPDFELIDAIRQALDIQTALIVGGQIISILVTLADDLHRRFHRQAGWIGDFESQLPAIALAEERRGGNENDGCKSDDHREELAFVSLAVFRGGVERRFPPRGLRWRASGRWAILSGDGGRFFL